VKMDWSHALDELDRFTRENDALREAHKRIIEKVLAKSQNAYEDYISKLRCDECLGWEIKVERGEFGKREFDAHCAANQLLGKHRAYHDVLGLLRAAIDEVREKKNNV